MKTYLITIKPTSGFGTPIKGDTLFGHLCWQLYYNQNLFGKTLDELLSDYDNNPFLVLSSAYPKINDEIALKRPELPIDMLFNFDNLSKEQIIKERKKFKGKNWFLISLNKPNNLIKGDELYYSDEDLFQKLINNLDLDKQKNLRKLNTHSVIIDFEQMHNTINRLLGKTGEGRFAPFSVNQKVYLPELELALFVGIRKDLKIDNVIGALERIGKIGYGKDSSIGLGKFIINGHLEINLNSFFNNDANACYTLSPSVPDSNSYKKIYFSPFIRFGRHGDNLARSANPFKNPIIMADEGAVYIMGNNLPNKPFIGRAIRGVSKVKQETVHQGYSLFIPVKVEE